MASPGSAKERFLNDQFRSAAVARSFGVDLLHFPKGFIPRRHSRLKVAATIHDDIPCQYVDGVLGEVGWRTQLKNRYFAAEIKHSYRRADLVFTDSRFAAHSLESRFGSRRIVTAGLGLRNGSAAADGSTSLGEGTFVLHLSSPLPHKRSTQAVEWTSNFIRRVRPDMSLVLVGSLPPDVALPQDGRVTHVPGPVSEPVLNATMRSAKAVIVNSATEGFGLPPCESFLVATPCVWPKAGSLSEVLSGFPCGFEPGNERSFATALMKALELDPRELSDLASVMHERHNWDRTAEAVLAEYRSLIITHPSDR